ncbi:MAG: NUDIX domain-containing protein [Candidatus Saccharimonadales bacterium]
MTTIHKSAGIIIQNRKLLVSRNKGKDYFIAPGGKIESGETASQALVRELFEEQSIRLNEDTLEFFGTFHAVAKGREDENVQLTMDIYLVEHFEGKLVPSNEIAENRWVTSTDASNIELGSIFEHDVIPILKKQDLID